MDKKRVKFDKKALSLLYKTVLKLKKEKQVKEFFSDIFSSKEIKDIARRVLAVRRLYTNKTYRDIYFESGMSMTTINKMYFKTKGSKLLRNIL